VITTIGPAHLEQFQTMENIIQEKLDLVRALPDDGIAFLNQDDKILKREAEKLSQKIIWYDGGEKLSFNAAFRIGEHFQMSEVEIKKGLQKFEPIGSRMNLILTKRGSTIIDDTYNANPVSVKFAIDYLAKQAQGRKIAILGDMLELGKESANYHRQIGQFARDKADVLIAVGDLVKNFSKTDFYYQNTEDAIEKINSDFKFQNGDWVLIKGSRRMKMEMLVEFLKNKI
jgi:UDP-N-acetylmuramoyl-tripeptide--D-alanyl-D-alanine ligase